tara:strand:- start:1036 stop:2715 length:1680 start_codon:yes stop_codon:yes gene_type:complete
MFNCGINIDIKGYIKSHIGNNNGHNFISSMEEIIHNSIDAKASIIYILKNVYGNSIIIDNGIGMDIDMIEKLTIMHKHNSIINDHNTIGKYGIGLKDALFCLGSKWYILSKIQGSEDIVYAEFDINIAKQISNNEIPLTSFIKTGNVTKQLEKKYKNILTKVKLINDTNDSFINFSGTIVYQCANEYKLTDLDLDEDENMEEHIEYIHSQYVQLYKKLQLRVIKNDINISYGEYINDTNNIIIKSNSIYQIQSFDWLSWDTRISGKYIEYIIKPYLTKKNHYKFLIYLPHNNTYYLYNKKQNIFEIKIEQKICNNNFIGDINVKYNIIPDKIHKEQSQFYKCVVKYENRLYGIMVSRNDLDLYTYPNEWKNFEYQKNTSIYNYIRCYISYTNPDLDNLFSIKNNKSLFNYNDINIKFKEIVNNINRNIYNIVSDEYDTNLKFILTKILQNYNVKRTCTNIIHIINNYNKLYTELKKIKTKKIFSLSSIHIYLKKKRKIQLIYYTKHLLQNWFNIHKHTQNICKYQYNFYNIYTYSKLYNTILQLKYLYYNNKLIQYNKY